MVVYVAGAVAAVSAAAAERSLPSYLQREPPVQAKVR